MRVFIETYTEDEMTMELNKYEYSNCNIGDFWYDIVEEPDGTEKVWSEIIIDQDFNLDEYNKFKWEI